MAEETTTAPAAPANPGAPANPAPGTGTGGGSAPAAKPAEQGLFDVSRSGVTETGELIDKGGKPPVETKGKEGEATETEVNPPGTPPTPTEYKVAGKTYKSVEDVVKALESSSAEGLRLFRALDAERKGWAKKESEFAQRARQLETDLEVLKKTPPFRELSAEELKALHEQDPNKAIQYQLDLRDHKAKTEAEAKRIRDEKEKRAREQDEMDAYIDERYEVMKKDGEKYPDFVALEPVMDEILTKTEGRIAGHRFTPDLLYIAAVGLATLRKGAESKKATTDATKKAAAEAAGKAGALGKTAGGGKTPTDGSQEDTDDAFNDRLIAAGPKSVFGG